MPSMGLSWQWSCRQLVAQLVSQLENFSVYDLISRMSKKFIRKNFSCLLTGYIISNQILPKIERLTTIVPSVIYRRQSPPTEHVYDAPENRENCYNNLDFDDGELCIGNNYEVTR